MSSLEVLVPTVLDGKRLDLALSILLGTSRQKIKTLFSEHHLSVSASTHRLSQRSLLPLDHKVHQGNILFIPEEITDLLQHPLIHDEPENLPIETLYIDEHFFIINKPSGFIMHPGAGCLTGTLMNALLYHYPAQEKLPRAGIVHRLDKDTTGLLIVARTQQSFDYFTQKLQERAIKRTYCALVHGRVNHQVIEKPIGRDKIHRTRMCVHHQGRYAKTTVHQEHFYSKYNISQIKCELSTGRTHQIRVHLQSIGHPLLGDPLYQHPLFSPKTYVHQDLLSMITRQALHAYSLVFLHPVTQEACSYEAVPPSDMMSLIIHLKKSDEPSL